MDRTAKIKATSSVATQTDSFQDPLGEISELVHINPFQDPSYTVADNSEGLKKLVHINSFQDPSYPTATDNSEECRTSKHIDSFQDLSQLATFDFFQDHSEEKRNLVQIDSFQDHHSGLYGNSSEIDSFQDSVIPQIDSFQDPMFVYSTKLFKLTPFKTPALSMGNYLQIDSVKSPWETSFIKNWLCLENFTQ